MDLNFPLILMSLVAVGGLIWLLDIVWLSKKRGPNDSESALVENAKSLTPVLAFVFINPLPRTTTTRGGIIGPFENGYTDLILTEVLAAC